MPQARSLEQLLRDLLAQPGATDSLDVAPEVTPETIREHLATRYDFSRPWPLSEVAEDVVDMLRRWSVHVTHPRYFGYFNPSVDASGILAEAIAAAYNPQLAVWSHAPAAVEIERHVLTFLARKIGLHPDQATAHFTVGGSEANHTAVIVALTERYPGYAAGGLRAIEARPRVYVSAEGHESIEKIAHATGLGREAVRRVATDSSCRLSVPALADAIAEDRAAGWDPLMVIATTGTTAVGAVDALPKILALREREHFWLHVDAAWGGACVMSPRLRPILSGIERVDSVTWDAHKWLSVPMAAGMFFCARREPVAQAFRSATGYMPTGTEGTVDPYVASLQWSRRFIGLKVFLLIAELGEEGLARRLEHQHELGDVLGAKLLARGWVVTNDTPLPLVCFTRPRWESRPELVAAAASAVVRGGQAWVSAIRRPDGRSWLRACISSFRTTEGDLDVLMEALERVRTAEA